MQDYHKHHIVFRSQGGLDFPLNLKELTYEQHEGPNGPHQNRLVDLAFKKELQKKLYNLFPKGFYTIEEISEKLGRTKRYFEKHFKKVPSTPEGLYESEDVIRKLMGGKIY